MNKCAGYLVITFLFISLISCSNSDDSEQSTIVTFNATLEGSNEVPSNASTAKGTAKLNYNKNTKIFTLTVTYTGLTPTSGHVHLGANDINGDILYTFTNLTSPITFTSPALNSFQESLLMYNTFYINLHSDTFPEGEIRGQLITTSPGGGCGSCGGTLSKAAKSSL
ncbi:CHRD domain-containing protein [Flavobacterium sp. M31R6]|uniref:CHRD domain-containing protein n=1 Tax=Flavobacterium sp. M31R6 TaxID=2739062 RepID=UPI001568884D|nr:CHRD domain-containing protein [Flavobacterium sp. M31R6]QKJ64098.1 CHRD domain-containing protein [Flavobacterium sp. M31R6]